ncbi:MbtH family protein [Streptomyces sp. GSL17-111]|uniref:MbtH family protein n=1 Tax=Streptomyces sp. GSL17-111 TaxID=3121596 RepID=UPI0030F47E3A
MSLRPGWFRRASFVPAHQNHGPHRRTVRDDEDQYSIWPATIAVPGGWHLEGTEGSRADRLAHIDEIWTDMRPRSLRERMAATG